MSNSQALPAHELTAARTVSTTSNVALSPSGKTSLRQESQSTTGGCQPLRRFSMLSELSEPTKPRIGSSTTRWLIWTKNTTSTRSLSVRQVQKSGGLSLVSRGKNPPNSPGKASGNWLKNDKFYRRKSRLHPRRRSLLSVSRIRNFTTLRHVTLRLWYALYS